jgi:hypothetical protein
MLIGHRSAQRPARLAIRCFYSDYVLLCLLRELSLASGKGTREAVLCVDTVNTVDGVQVLDQSDLEACCGTLTRRNRGVGQEVLPNLSVD